MYISVYFKYEPTVSIHFVVFSFGVIAKEQLELPCGVSSNKKYNDVVVQLRMYKEKCLLHE
jgi:hypothetical protein